MNWLYHLLGLDPDTSVHRITEAAWLWGQPLAPWLLATLAVGGLVLAGINFLPQIGMRAVVRVGTVLLRLAMLGLLVVILGRGEWQITAELDEPPQWTVLVDDSASMAVPDVDGQTRFAAARHDVEAVQRALAGRAGVAVATVSGQPLGVECGQGPTRFGRALTRVALERRGFDRLLLLTDGRDSEGRDLAALAGDIRARGIKVAVCLYGSPQPPMDISIAAAPDRSMIRLGEELAIRGALRGAGVSQGATVRLLENNTEVKAVSVPAEARGRFELRHRPAKAGRLLYTVEYTGRDSVAQDNRVSFTADVVPDKINVLLIEGFPRYEFKVMKSVLEVDPLVNLVSLCHLPGGGVYVQGAPLHRNPEQGLIASQAELFKYDVVILRDVSRNYFRAGGDTSESRLLNLVEFVTRRGGGLIVCGGQDMYRAGGYESSCLTQVLPFDLSNVNGGQPQFDGLFFVSIPKPAYDHPLLRLQGDPAANVERLNALRQLDGCNNVGRCKPMATPLLTRTLELTDATGKRREVTAPVLAYLPAGDGKVLATAADTLWRWQLQADFDDPPLTMLLANAVRYLAPPPDRRPDTPNIGFADAVPQVGQEMVLSTVLKDRNFDPVRNAELVVTVTRPDGASERLYPRDLPEEPGYYEYRVPLDLPGTYKVAAKHGANEVTREFVAGVAAGEFADLSPDRDAMARFAQAAGGEVVAQLPAWLARAGLEPSRRVAQCSLEVWNSPLVLLLFLALVSLDCFIRKRAGLA